MPLKPEILARLTERQRRTVAALGEGQYLPPEHFGDDFEGFTAYLDGMEIVADGRASESERRAAFIEPRHAYGAVVAATGVKPATLRNWLTRKQLVLNADEGHTEEKWRLFSVRDVVQIAVLNALSCIGLSIRDAVSISDMVMPRIEDMAVNIGGFAGDPVLHFWKIGDDWRGGTAFDTTKGMLATDALPPAAITLRPFDILAQVRDELAKSGSR